MCLDPRPDRPYRAARPSRRLSGRPSYTAHALALPAATLATPVNGAALWALDTLAGDDELVARGWVVLSREN